MTATFQDAEAYLTQFNFTGGVPLPKDFAPSIVFTVVYALLLPLVFWRCISTASRSTLLIRPAIFVTMRVGTWALRAVMSKNQFNLSELIAQVIMVSIGFLFIVSPVIDLWQRHVLSEVSKADRPRWLNTLSKVAQLSLLAAVVTAIVAASLMSGSTSQDTIKTLRRVSYILSLIVVVIALFGIIYTHFHFRLDARGTGLLAWVCLVCTVCGVYRCVQIFSVDPTAPVRSRAAFYICQATMEVLAVVPLLAVNLNMWYPSGRADAPPARDIENNEYKHETPRY